MALSLFRRKAYFFVLVGLLTLLAACGGDTTTTTTSGSTQTGSPPSTATATALVKLMTLVGQPKAKMLAGTTFEVNGMVKNGDSKQHDIFLQATLLDASGKKIATTDIHNVDEVAGGATATYALQGTTSQPTWTSVQVTVIKVTENINGSGTD